MRAHKCRSLTCRRSLDRSPTPLLCSPALPSQSVATYTGLIPWTLTCNTGYFLFGNGAFNCQGSTSSWYTAPTHPCTSVCFASSYDGNCRWCCGMYYYYTITPALGTSYCYQCVPPVSGTALTTKNPPLVAGQAAYLWSCQLGYYAAPLTRICRTTSASTIATWDVGAINCQRCPTPTTPPNGQVAQGASLDIWNIQCLPGYYNSAGASLASSQCRSDFALPTWVGDIQNPIATCTVCTSPLSGYYCTGTQTATQCPGGRFGLPGAVLSVSHAPASVLLAWIWGFGSSV